EIQRLTQITIVKPYFCRINFYYMNRKLIAALAILLILVFVFFKFWKDNSDMDTNDLPVNTVASIGFSIIKSYPHNPTSFTQGLMIYKGELYEGTGMNNESRLMKV